jgi:hypothetical protein
MELAQIFSYSITFEKRVLNEQDKFGETALHAALASDLFEQVVLQGFLSSSLVQLQSKQG